MRMLKPKDKNIEIAPFCENGTMATSNTEKTMPHFKLMNILRTKGAF